MKVHELLSDPSKWTQEAAARDITGEWVSPPSATAVCYCSLGAIEKCYPNDYYRMRRKLEKYLEENYGDHRVVRWNDDSERTYEEVLQVFKTLDI